jgi:hypothetical protein
MKLPLALLAAALAAPLLAQSAGAPFVLKESGRGFTTLQDAVSAIGDGRGTILVAPGRHRQCAVQTAGEIAYVASQFGSAVFEGATCEGKAALVLRGRAARVEGLVFQNLRVADGNGAGIRLEKGSLAVSESLFRDSESGILSGNDAAATITVERSTFSGLGRCDRGLDCAHSIYIGNYGGLAVRRVRFERGRGGHYVKTRAARIEVADSSFDDSAGSTTNYMIDLSAGASGRIERNVFVQGKDKENYSGMIVVAAEGKANSSNGLIVTGNSASIAPGQEHGTAFVADLSGDAIRVENNRLAPRIERFQKR